jgi:hypothetical protein
MKTIKRLLFACIIAITISTSLTSCTKDELPQDPKITSVTPPVVTPPVVTPPVTPPVITGVITPPVVEPPVVTPPVNYTIANIIKKSYTVNNTTKIYTYTIKIQDNAKIFDVNVSQQWYEQSGEGMRIMYQENPFVIIKIML